jgi:hypothetical protein
MIPPWGGGGGQQEKSLSLLDLPMQPPNILCIAVMLEERFSFKRKNPDERFQRHK